MEIYLYFIMTITPEYSKLDVLKPLIKQWEVGFFKGNIAFINLKKNIFVDCNYDKNPKKPWLKDIGILSSTDPVY